MNFIALLSGGKDSIYNIIKCKEQGHTLICALNINSGEEKDSYMYQYAGNNLVPGICNCLGVPLETIKTDAVSVNKKMDYTKTEGDEVEDLYSALLILKNKYLFSAISVGAIKSKYQYNRVKNVCERLGIKILAYLWERQQKPLLKEMIDTGIHALVVKAGEKPLSSLVGESIEKVYAVYSKYVIGEMKKYDCLIEEDFNMCGEGGEYETLVLDCPIFKSKIIIDSSRIVTDSRGVSSFVIDKYHLEPKLN